MEFLEYCPDTELTFQLNEEDIFYEQTKKQKEITNNIDDQGYEYEKTIAPDTPTKQKKEKTIKITKAVLIEIEERLYKKVYDRVCADLNIKSIISEMKKKSLNFKKIIQLNKEWKIINYFISAARAGQTLNIAPSSISACLNWKRKTAWWFIFIKNNND